MAKYYLGQEGPGDGGGKLIEVHADDGASPEGVQVLGPEAGVGEGQAWELLPKGGLHAPISEGGVLAYGLEEGGWNVGGCMSGRWGKDLEGFRGSLGGEGGEPRDKEL